MEIIQKMKTTLFSLISLLSMLVVFGQPAMAQTQAPTSTNYIDFNGLGKTGVWGAVKNHGSTQNEWISVTAVHMQDGKVVGPVVDFRNLSPDSDIRVYTDKSSKDLETLRKIYIAGNGNMVIGMQKLQMDPNTVKAIVMETKEQANQQLQASNTIAGTGGNQTSVAANNNKPSSNSGLKDAIATNANTNPEPKPTPTSTPIVTPSPAPSATPTAIIELPQTANNTDENEELVTLASLKQSPELIAGIAMIGCIVIFSILGAYMYRKMRRETFDTNHNTAPQAEAATVAANERQLPSELWFLVKNYKTHFTADNIYRCFAQDFESIEPKS